MAVRGRRLSSVFLSKATRNLSIGAIRLKGKASSKGKGKETKPEEMEGVTNTLQGMSNTVCTGANILKDGEDPLLKVDSNYPNWLWSLSDPSSANDDPNSKGYWRRKNKANAHSRNREMKLKAN